MDSDFGVAPDAGNVAVPDAGVVSGDVAVADAGDVVAPDAGHAAAALVSAAYTGVGRTHSVNSSDAQSISSVRNVRVLYF